MTDFWTQVVRRANSCLGAVVGVLEYSSDAKISNFHLPVLGHKDVLSFEVSVQDFPVVDMLDCESHLDKPVEYLIFRVAN